MSASPNVSSFVASTDNTQGQQTANKLDQKKSEALKKYQALQFDRQSSYVEGPTTPGTARALDAEAKAKALGEPGLAALDAGHHVGIAAFRSLEPLLLDTEPVSKPLGQFEATLPKNTPAALSTINFSSNF